MESDMPYLVISSGEEVFLQYKNNSITRLLSINIINNIIKNENPDILQKKVIYKMRNAKAILGIINIKDIEFVLTVLSSDIVGKIKNEIIYKITEVEFLKFQMVK